MKQRVKKIIGFPLILVALTMVSVQVSVIFSNLNFLALKRLITNFDETVFGVQKNQID